MDALTPFEAIQRGDTEAFKEMFFQYYAPLCAYASRFLVDEDAEELVQDLMAYIWEARHRLQIKGSLKSYLFVAVKNRSYNAIRQQKYQKRAQFQLHEHLNEQQFDDPDFYMAKELARKIDHAVQELPDNYRQTFEMSRYGGITNAKISSELEVSIKTVEYRISKSLKILRGKLKEYIP